MPKSPNQKIKLLYLMQILLEETDDDHALTSAQLIDKLAALDLNTITPLEALNLLYQLKKEALGG